jgi:hypothetical protein
VSAKSAFDLFKPFEQLCAGGEVQQCIIISLYHSRFKAIKHANPFSRLLATRDVKSSPALVPECFVQLNDSTRARVLHEVLAIVDEAIKHS